MDWIVTEIDGKVASIAGDYRHLPGIAAAVAALPARETGTVGTRKISTPELLEFAQFLTWEDLRLFGTPFQLKVWKTLFDLPRKLYSYTELAALAENPGGVRAVAHAAALNPVAYVIPCHLVIPKESLDKAHEIRTQAEKTLFKGSDLYLLDSLDVGAYAYGPDVKRELIKLQLTQ
ncbi:MAG: methylated-DNA--[protein]-cysteine S-methyltransferase [Bacteroidales bacterium]|nr:methylated-DNA--[protein]-cysteine S-methyltransferase [Bacteroidales bacterium]